MPDQRSVMKEFRSLDAKRAKSGLTPEEESRYALLRDLVGAETEIRQGFDVDAAAAQLRDSLLPAGLRNRPPPATEREVAAELPVADALHSGLAAEPFPAAEVSPQLEGFLDPALAPEGAPEAYDPAASGDDATQHVEWDSNAPAYDPNAPAYDPNAPAYDPSAPYDASAPAFDPDAPYDPNAPAYDPNAPYDASAPAFDPNAPYDPNAPAYDPDAPYGASAPAFDPNAPYDPNAPAYDPNAPYDASAPAFDPNAPYDPNAPAFDPNAPYDASAPAFDPNAPYDPNAPAFDPNAPYDPNAPAYDPNAPYGASAPAFDPNAPYDPNAPAYDPNAPYGASAPAFDPNAPPQDAAGGLEPGVPAAWDPDAPYPVNEAARQLEPVQGLDANAPAAYDADVPYDPNAPHDAAALGYDPNASPEAGAQAYPAPLEETYLPEGEPFLEPEPVAEQSADVAALPPEGWYAEAAAEQGEGQGATAANEDAGLESLLPFDPAAEAAIAPDELPEGFGRVTGEYDDTAGFAARHGDPAPADLPPEGEGFEATRSMAADASEGWQPEGVLDEGFQLASGGSFDASAEAVVPEWAGGTAPPPWEGPAPAQPGPEGGAISADAFSGGEFQEGAPEIVEPLEVAAEASEPGSGEQEYLEPLPPAPEPAEEPAPGAELGPDAFGTLELPEEAARPAGLEAEPIPTPTVGDLSMDVETLEVEAVDVTEEHAPSLAGPAPALDFSRPDLSAGAPSEEEPAFLDAAPGQPGPEAGPGPAFDLSVEPAPELPPLDLGVPEELAAPQPAGPPLLAEEEIPTIDGEEILEEIPVEELIVENAAPPEPAPPEVPATPGPPPAEPVRPGAAPPPALLAPPPAAPSAEAVSAGERAPAAIAAPAGGRDPDLFVPGSHRVVVHTVEGQAKRGMLEDVDLAGDSLELVAQPGTPPEAVPSDKVKAIFFMLAPGEQAPSPEGKKVRVTFRDGRQVAGFSPDYREGGLGFFMIPADTRTNTGRIWVYHAAVRAVAVS